MDLNKLQKEILKNKIKQGFNTTDVNQEFCYLYAEVAEAYDAFRKKKHDLGEELADIGIFLLGISEMLNIDLAKEINAKVIKNSKRKYITKDGVHIRVEGE